MRNAIKNETKNVNKDSFFGSIFVISTDLLASRAEKIAWWPLFLNLILTCFPIMNNWGKFKDILLTSFYCITPP